jgi:site-specific DNA-methyltransferase (adenine-specific)
LYKDDLNEKDYEKWIKNVLNNIRCYLKEGASAYIWNGHAKFYFVHQVLKELGFHVSTVITWAKPTFAISYGNFNQQTEFCIFSWLKNGPHKWYGPTNETNLWEISRDKASELIHPTQKSVQIPSRAIRNSSIKGDIIFDGFLGSGSSLIAAESLGRCCYGMEIEPRYVDAIVKRYIDFVGADKISSDILNKYRKEEA